MAACVRLQSVDHGDLIIPRMLSNSFGCCSFHICKPTMWNKLPVNLPRIDITREQFITASIAAVWVHIWYKAHWRNSLCLETRLKVYLLMCFNFGVWFVYCRVQIYFLQKKATSNWVSLWQFIYCSSFM